jgi:hypothetical protein
MFALTVEREDTLETLIDARLRAHHERSVRVHAAGQELSRAREWTIGMRIRRRFTRTVVIHGPKFSVADRTPDACDMWVSTDEASAAYFLADAKGERRLCGTPHPSMPIATPTDPRLLSRIASESAKVECALRMADGTRLLLMFGCGKHAARGIDDFDPEVELEVPEAVFVAVSQGRTTPSGALEHPDLSIRGKKLVAVKLALALAPLFVRTAATS